MRTIFLPALLIVLPVLAGASVPSTSAYRDDLPRREAHLSHAALRGEEFKDLARTGEHRCSLTTLPEPLATPDPLLDSVGQDAHVTVSFIIGTDGRTHSPLILESAGSAPDRAVLRMVRSWRFRPATCNGVPTDFEGKIQFSRK